MTENRIQLYDILRGIAIILVVAIHALNFKSSNVSDFNNLSLLTWRCVIGFAVPLFVTISGFFAAKRDLSTKNSYLKFLERQIPRVLIPYFVWACFYSIFLLKSGESLSSILFRIATFQTIGPFYFIALIIQLYILAPIAQKLNSPTGLVNSALLSIIFCISIYYCRYYTKIQIPVIIYAGLFLPYLFFFVLGIYLGSGKEVIQTRKNALYFVILCLIVSIADSYVEYNKYSNFDSATSTVKISSLLYSFSVILLLVRKQNELFSSKVLQFVGGISFGIYFMHLYMLNKLVGIFGNLTSFFNPLIFQLFLVTIVVIVCSIISYLLHKINSNLFSKYLGI